MSPWLFYNQEQNFTRVGHVLYSIFVPDSKSRNIPEVVVVWRWTVGVWEFGGGGVVG